MSAATPWRGAPALDRRLLAAALGLIALYLAPLLVMGQGTTVLIHDFQLDPWALAALDVRFVLSAAEIGAPERSGLIPRRAFRPDDSAWHISLYGRAEPAEFPASAAHP